MANKLLSVTITYFDEVLGVEVKKTQPAKYLDEIIENLSDFNAGDNSAFAVYKKGPLTDAAKALLGNPKARIGFIVADKSVPDDTIKFFSNGNQVGKVSNIGSYADWSASDGLPEPGVATQNLLDTITEIIKGRQTERRLNPAFGMDLASPIPTANEIADALPKPVTFPVKHNGQAYESVPVTWDTDIMAERQRLIDEEKQIQKIKNEFLDFCDRVEGVRTPVLYPVNGTCVDGGSHQPVDMGFMHSKLVCKKCDCDLE